MGEIAIRGAYGTPLETPHDVGHGATEREAREALVLAITQQRSAIVASLFAAGFRWDDAEDLAQEAIARALARLDTLREPSRGIAWLYGIVRLLRVDAYRGRSRRPVQDTEALELADGALPASEVHAVEEDRASLARAVAELDLPARDLIDLRYAHGLSYGQIAERLATTPGAIAVRLHRLHARLRRWFAAMGIHE